MHSFMHKYTQISITTTVTHTNMHKVINSCSYRTLFTILRLYMNLDYPYLAGWILTFEVALLRPMYYHAALFKVLCRTV